MVIRGLQQVQQFVLQSPEEREEPFQDVMTMYPVVPYHNNVRRPPESVFGDAFKIKDQLLNEQAVQDPNADDDNDVPEAERLTSYSIAQVLLKASVSTLYGLPPRADAINVLGKAIKDHQRTILHRKTSQDLMFAAASMPMSLG